MNAARPEPNTRSKPTHTFWPVSRPPQTPMRREPPPAKEKNEDEHATEEPGYGFGV